MNGWFGWGRQATIASLNSQKQKNELLFLFHWLKWNGIKIYYNSTVIRAGIYLLSAIMKNFVLNYERQLVDSCDNNGPSPFNSHFFSQLALPNGRAGERNERVDGQWGSEPNKRNEISLELFGAASIDGMWCCLLFFFVVGYGRWHRQWLRRKERTNKQTTLHSINKSKKESEINSTNLNGIVKWINWWNQLMNEASRELVEVDWTGLQALAR